MILLIAMENINQILPHNGIAFPHSQSQTSFRFRHRYVVLKVRGRTSTDPDPGGVDAVVDVPLVVVVPLGRGLPHGAPGRSRKETGSLSGSISGRHHGFMK